MPRLRRCALGVWYDLHSHMCTAPALVAALAPQVGHLEIGNGWEFPWSQDSERILTTPFSNRLPQPAGKIDRLSITTAGSTDCPHRLAQYLQQADPIRFHWQDNRPPYVLSYRRHLPPTLVLARRVTGSASRPPFGNRVQTLVFWGAPWAPPGLPLDRPFPAVEDVTLHIRWTGDRGAVCTVTEGFCTRQHRACLSLHHLSPATG